MSLRQKLYNLEYMRHFRKKHRNKAREEQMRAQGKCIYCEIILASEPGHDCERPLFVGWMVSKKQHGAWDEYFYYFEQETESGMMYFKRVARKGFEYLENNHGELAVIQQIVLMHTTEQLPE